jgi:hypothetical protein
VATDAVRLNQRMSERVAEPSAAAACRRVIEILGEEES